MKKRLKKLIPASIIRSVYRSRVKKRYNVKFGKGASSDLQTVFEGGNMINDHSNLSKSFIGYGSYIAGYTSLSRVKIGKFCSIGQNVQNNLGLHPTDFVSSHPAFFSTKRQAGFSFVDQDLFEEHKRVPGDSDFLVTIGHDVWVGNNVVLMDGISIGHGAIVGAGAVVTKDIPPYHIVGGIPARLIRKRFSDEQIAQLLQRAWWDKSLDWIREHHEHFIDIERFLSMPK